MIKRFILLKNAVCKVQIDFNRTMDISKAVFEFLKVLVRKLIPIKIDSERMGARDATLLIAQTVYDFMFKELDAIKSPFSIYMKNTLRSELLRHLVFDVPCLNE